MSELSLLSHVQFAACTGFFVLIICKIICLVICFLSYFILSEINVVLACIMFNNINNQAIQSSYA